MGPDGAHHDAHREEGEADGDDAVDDVVELLGLGQFEREARAEAGDEEEDHGADEGQDEQPDGVGVAREGEAVGADEVLLDLPRDHRELHGAAEPDPPEDEEDADREEGGGGERREEGWAVRSWVFLAPHRPEVEEAGGREHGGGRDEEGADPGDIDEEPLRLVGAVRHVVQRREAAGRVQADGAHLEGQVAEERAHAAGEEDHRPGEQGHEGADLARRGLDLEEEGHPEAAGDEEAGVRHEEVPDVDQDPVGLEGGDERFDLGVRDEQRAAQKEEADPHRDAAHGGELPLPLAQEVDEEHHEREEGEALVEVRVRGVAHGGHEPLRAVQRVAERRLHRVELGLPRVDPAGEQRPGLEDEAHPEGPRP